MSENTSESDETGDPCEALALFALEFRARPGVAEACRTLQAEHVGDACLILFLLWLSSDGRTIWQRDLEKSVWGTAYWQRSLVGTLRAVAQDLKEIWLPHLTVGPFFVACHLDRVVEMAERMEFDSLYFSAQEFAYDEPPREPASAARENLTRYAKHIDQSFPEPVVGVLCKALQDWTAGNSEPGRA